MVELPILPLDRGLYLIGLDCIFQSDLSQRLGIVAQVLPGESAHQFCRHDMVGLIKVRPELLQKA